MPQLNPNNLPFSPAVRAVKIIRDQWRGATGIFGNLNRSVEFGVDALLKDSIEQRQLETAMPCIRIVAQTDSYLMASNAGSAVNSTIPLSAYFMYYFGNPQSSVLPVEFVDLRDRHIRWNLEWLKDKKVKPFDSIGLDPEQKKDDAGANLWWWTGGTQDVQITHDVDLQEMGISVAFSAANGFTCSRVDFSITVMNHATFTGDYIPYQQLLMTPYRIDTDVSADLELTDIAVEFTNASRLGVNAPASGLYAGLYYFLYNYTDNDWESGDFWIPKNTGWMVVWNGTQWRTIQSYS